MGKRGLPPRGRAQSRPRRLLCCPQDLRAETPLGDLWHHDFWGSRLSSIVGGIRGLGELQKRVDSGEMKVAFALYPVSMQQLIDIADSGNIMPPKTTWFEPKLRSGVVIHEF